MSLNTELQHNIRNILMNELGLSREAIRAEADRIIKEELDKKFKQVFEGDWAMQIVQRHIDKVFYGNTTGRSIGQRVTEELGIAIKKAVAEKVTEAVSDLTIKVVTGKK